MNSRIDWLGICGQQNANQVLTDWLNGVTQLDAHAIAESFVRITKLDVFPRAYAEAWPYMLGNIGNVEQGVAAYLDTLDKEERARWAEKDTQNFVAAYRDIMNLYRLALAVESFNPPPHQTAYILTGKWSGKHMSRQDYIDRSLAYAEEFRTQDPAISAYMASVKAAVMMDEVDLSVLRGTRPEPDKVKYHSVLHRWDRQVRANMLGTAYPDLYEAKDRFGDRRIMDSYWPYREHNMKCVHQRQNQYHVLSSLSADRRDVLARKENGQWCGSYVAVDVKSDDPDFFLGQGLQDLAAQIGPEVAGQCPAVQEILLSGYTEDGHAKVAQTKGRKSTNWRGLAHKPTGTQAAFLRNLKAAKSGDATAQGEVGTAFFNGLGLAKNERRAEQWLEKGAKGGNPLAQAELAWFLNTKGKTNYQQAVYWANESARQGDPVGHFYRARLEAPWHSRERFAELVLNNENPFAMPLINYSVDMKQAEQLCLAAPYKDDPRYTNHCANIAFYTERLKRDYRGGGGGNDCDPVTGYHCVPAGMSAADAHDAMQLMGGM